MEDARGYGWVGELDPREFAAADGVRRLLAVLVDNGALDADKAREWTVVRCVDYWLWGVEHGLTNDPKRCQRILEALA